MRTTRLGKAICFTAPTNLNVILTQELSQTYLEQCLNKYPGILWPSQENRLSYSLHIKGTVAGLGQCQGLCPHPGNHSGPETTLTPPSIKGHAVEL